MSPHCLRHGTKSAGLPGARRHQAVAKAQAEGISLADALHQELLKLAGRSRKK